MIETIIAKPISGDYRIDVLLATGTTSADSDSYRWNWQDQYGTEIELTYSFASVTADYWTAEDKLGFEPFNEGQRGAVREILTKISENFAIDFVEVDEGAGQYGTIRFANNSQGDASAGYAYLPGESDECAGDVFINRDDATNLMNVLPSEYAYLALVHEIGHALGLKHPGNYNAGEDLPDLPGNYLADAEDNTDYTVMSYTAVGGQIGYEDGYYPYFFSRYDYLALNYLYGARSVREGGTIWAFADVGSRQTINDSSGYDTFMARRIATACTVDLASGGESCIGGYEGAFNVMTTYGTTIEAAYTGAGNDWLKGNASGNSLNGGPGNDTLQGGGGDDFISGSMGYDIAVFSGPRSRYQIEQQDSNYLVTDLEGDEGRDTLYLVEALQFSDGLHTLKEKQDGNAQNDLLRGTAGDDQLYGVDGSDRLFGDLGDDILSGGSGGDRMRGGEGNDFYEVDHVRDRVWELHNQGTDIVGTYISYQLPANVETLYLYYRNGTGISGKGNRGDNLILGDVGNETLNGGYGNDVLTGTWGGIRHENETNVFVFDSKLDPQRNIDTITDFVSGNDMLYLSKKIFRAYRTSGMDLTGDLVTGAGAVSHDNSDRLIYDTNTGYLYYDRDGSGAKAATHFATLTGAPSLVASDLHIY